MQSTAEAFEIAKATHRYVISETPAALSDIDRAFCTTANAIWLRSSATTAVLTAFSHVREFCHTHQALLSHTQRLIAVHHRLYVTTLDLINNMPIKQRRHIVAIIGDSVAIDKSTNTVVFNDLVGSYEVLWLTRYGTPFLVLPFHHCGRS